MRDESLGLYSVDDILSIKRIDEQKYVNGMMYTFEKKTVVKTPIREKDICIEKIFIFEKEQNKK